LSTPRLLDDMPDRRLSSTRRSILELQLLVDLVVNARRPPHGGAPAEPRRHEACITFPMASVSCAQSAVSTASCFRPARVSL
jgi:hypothetical protein